MCTVSQVEFLTSPTNTLWTRVISFWKLWRKSKLSVYRPYLMFPFRSELEHTQVHKYGNEVFPKWNGNSVNSANVWGNPIKHRSINLVNLNWLSDNTLFSYTRSCSLLIINIFVTEFSKKHFAKTQTSCSLLQLKINSVFLQGMYQPLLVKYRMINGFLCNSRK